MADRKIHRMNLHPGPFERMRAGEKTDELRLRDDKRRLIRVGDWIEFRKRPDFREALTAEVTALKTYPSFADLYEGVKARYPQHDRDSFIRAMREYYSPEDEARYGVLEIDLKVIAPS